MAARASHTMRFASCDAAAAVAAARSVYEALKAEAEKGSDQNFDLKEIFDSADAQRIGLLCKKTTVRSRVSPWP